MVWLAIYPPRPQQILIDGQQQWKCYNIQFAVLIETDAIFAVLFAVLLILITMFFSALTWKHSAINHLESRYIAFSCYVMLTTWAVFAFLFKWFHLVELRDLFIVIANLLVGTTILVCMFIRKLIIFYKLNRAKKYNSNKTHHLVSSPSISSAASSYYGSVGSGSIHSTVERSASSNNKSNKKINEQLKRTAKQTAKQQTRSGSKSKNRESPEMNQDNLDNVSTISAMTTTSSIISSVKSYFTSNKTNKQEDHNQDVEPEFNLSSIATIDQSQFNVNQHNLQQELYPMDVYDAVGSRQQSNQNSQNSQQPDSLFYSKKNMFNSNHSLYLMEEKDYI